MILSPKNFIRSLITKGVNLRLHYETHLGRGIVLGRDVEGYKHVNFGGQNGIGRGVVFTGDVKIGYGTTISANSYIIGPVAIGNYCQIGANVGILAKDHPTSFMSTYINQNLFSGRLRSHEIISQVLIGHDVWIGQGAIILRGVTIGNGVVVGAGAVVTESIPDYSIAVGNPARTIKKRFPDDVCNLINLTRWWLMLPEDLLPYENAFHIDFLKKPGEFVDAVKNMLSSMNI